MYREFTVDPKMSPSKLEIFRFNPAYSKYYDENSYDYERRAPYPRGHAETSKFGEMFDFLPDMIKEHMNEELARKVLEHIDKIAYLIVAYFVLTAQSKLLILAVLIILYYHFK